MNELFFELLQVALGQRSSLLSTPTSNEWIGLFHMSQKQSLMGICFYGVKKLPDVQKVNLSTQLIIHWLGMTVLIQDRNKIFNQRCVELQETLKKSGFKSSILKGQGMAALYGLELSSLRQPGDIDIWIQGGMEKIFRFCEARFGEFDFDYINAHTPFFDDVEVELHWRIHAIPNLWLNQKLQSWFQDNENMIHSEIIALDNANQIIVPNTQFNLFFILLHCYHHMFESGLGLRQFMDYYFLLRSYVLKCSFDNMLFKDNLNLKELLEEFGLVKFTSAVMWILGRVFGLEREYMLCEPNELEGVYLLNEVLQGGNFGHYDERKCYVKNQYLAPFVERLQHNWRLASHYPREFFWSPIWLVWHFFWKRFWKYRKKSASTFRFVI